jgi:hypothetical protein
VLGDGTAVDVVLVTVEMIGPPCSVVSVPVGLTTTKLLGEEGEDETSLSGTGVFVKGDRLTKLSLLSGAALGVGSEAANESTTSAVAPVVGRGGVVEVAVACEVGITGGTGTDAGTGAMALKEVLEESASSRISSSITSSELWGASAVAIDPPPLSGNAAVPDAL